MSRQEQIEKATPWFATIAEQMAWQDGACWADMHADPDLKKKWAEKAVEWLKKNLPEKTCVICSGVASIYFDNVISEFYRAMED